MPTPIDMIALSPFGEWTVLQKSDRSIGGHTYWLCRCSCGVEKEVLGINLRNGKTTSCGHALKTAGGLYEKYTNEYDVWRQMKARCEDPSNPAYKYYGDIGINVCEEWRASFPKFLEDMGPQPFHGAQLDRKNNDLGYYPWNCRWVNRKQNMRNKSTTIWLEYNGERKTLMEWSEQFKVPATNIRSRLAAGWSVAKALETPIKRRDT